MSIKSSGYTTGRRHYRMYKNGVRNESIYGNPFEPGTYEYEDFWDGWVYEESLFSAEL